MTALDSNFRYETRAVRVIFRVGAAADLPGELDRDELRRVLLLTTPGRAHTLDAIIEGLGERLAATYAGARVHVPTDAVMAAQDLADRVRPDVLVTFGGGSAIGLGKAIAQKTGLPLVAVPTTYSGSEMTSIWGVTDAGAKRTGRDHRVAPRLVIYDPELTYDLPPTVSAVSGMNAIAHAVESAWAPDASPVSELLAWDAIRRLSDNLPLLRDMPRDPDARAGAFLGAHLAGRTLDMTTMGLHHRLCHVLGGSFGMPHAGTHAALLPCVAAFNAGSAPEAMVRIAAALRTEDAVAGLADLTRQLETPTLRELGFNASMIPRAAALAASGNVTNPRPVTEEGVRYVLESALAV